MSYVGEVIADSPVGYWRFGQQTGIASYDSGSGLRPLILGGGAIGGQLFPLAAECFSGPVLGGVAFECLNAGWSTWYPSGTPYGTPATLECFCWLQSPANALQSRGWLMAMGTATGGTDAISMGWNIDKPSCGVGSTNVDSATAVARQTWHHFAYACDATSSLLYVDGSLVATNSAIAAAGREQIHIGYNGSGSGFQLKAILAEPAVYGTKLSAARIAAHWAAADNTSSLPVKLSAGGAVGPPLSVNWSNAP